MEARVLDAPTEIPTIQITNFFEFSLEREFIPAPKKQRYIFVGRVSSDKGILSFARIWSSVASANSELIICGDGAGSYFETLCELSRRDQRIQVIGEVDADKIQDKIRSCGVLVLPTGLDDKVTENFGNVVVEAFIAGRPVMVTAGLHWDELSGTPALITFLPEHEETIQAIRHFDELSQDNYLESCRAAFKLARQFHFSEQTELLKSTLLAAVSGTHSRGQRFRDG